MIGAIGASWTPLSLGSACVLWLRADVGNTTTWTDQSASGANASWNVAPTSTTLGGQAAWDVSASNCWANNTSNSLITAGSAYTPLIVGKSKTSTGGALFTLRRSATYSSTQLEINSGETIFYGDGTAENTSTSANLSTTMQSPFLMQVNYGGSSNKPTLRFNRTNEGAGSSFTGTQSSENGSTGFYVCTNSASQSWAGVIAEIVVVNRAITGAEQTSWENYVSSRYGI